MTHLSTQIAQKPGPTIAIDIGRSGAVALFDRDGRLVDVEDLPVLQDGPGYRPTISAPLLAALIRRWQPTQAVVEHVSARPGEAAPGAFAFGHSRGTIAGVLGAQAISVRWVTPAWWKRRAGIPPGKDMKDMARSVAIARWPDRAESFARARDHDRAEACLIGLAYITDTLSTRSAA